MADTGNEIVALLVAALHAAADGDGPDEVLALLAAEHDLADPAVVDELSAPGERRVYRGAPGVADWVAALPPGLGYTSANIRVPGPGRLCFDFYTDRPVRWRGTVELQLDAAGRVRGIRVAPAG